MGSLERRYRWNYLQSRNRNTGMENKHMNTKGRREGWDKLGDWDKYIYSIDTMYKIDNWESTVEHKELYSVLCGDLNGKEIQKRGDKCKHMAVQQKLTQHFKAWKWKWSLSVVSDSLDPMDCSLPSSSIHGIFQAIVLEWIAISFSRGSSQPRDRTQVSCIVDRRF